MAEQFEEKKDNISEEEIKDTASTNEDNNGTVNQDEQTEEAVETVENKDTAEASDTASDSSSDDEGKKKGFFGKEKKDKKDKKDQKIDELTDQYRRTLAEFDNYRKRTEKESPAKRPRSEPTRRSAKIPSAWEQTNVEEVEDGPSLEVEDQLTEWVLRRSVR